MLEIGGFAETHRIELDTAIGSGSSFSEIEQIQISAKT